MGYSARLAGFQTGSGQTASSQRCRKAPLMNIIIIIIIIIPPPLLLLLIIMFIVLIIITSLTVVINGHGKMRAECDKICQHVTKPGKLRQNVATRAHSKQNMTKRNVAKCGPSDEIDDLQKKVQPEKVTYKSLKLCTYIHIYVYTHIYMYPA